MSKIICDICGTAYPETADQCPICGSAKQVDSQNVSEVAPEAAEQAAKTAVKGGHFSNSNVRKRNKGKAVPVVKKKAPKKAKPAEEKPVEQEEPVEEEKSNRGLVAVVWVLLIAVLLVLAYILTQFVLPMYGIDLQDLLSGKPAETTSATDNTTIPQDTVPEDTGIACTGISVDDAIISLDFVGCPWLITVNVEPADTTDVVTFKSADENVAIVNDQGRVTAIGPGETVITITCGKVVKQVKVECPFGEDTTVPEETTIPEETTAPTTEEPTEEPTEPPVTEPPVPDFGLFEQDDVTFAYIGETFEFESGDIYLSEIYWTSDDPSVATVVNGEVTAVGPGYTVIRGEYNGRTDSCIIRCDFEEGTTKPEEDEDNGDHPEWPYLYPNTDVSIAVGEEFELTYVNVDGEWPDIDWESDDSSIASVDGDWVTGISYGVTTIRGTYDGEEITCIVRVIL